MQPIIIEANKTTQSQVNGSILKQVGAYCRVSSEKEMQINSFDAQVKYYTEYINQHEDWNLVKIYADEGITGTNTKRRSGLKDMLRDCRNKKLDLIICKSISRMGRNTADLLKIVRETRELGIDIFFENENIHTLGSGGEFLITVFASLAQDTSRQISENVVWGQDKAMRNGTIFGNSYIMGYDLVDKKLVINEEQAKTVRRVFDLFLEGNGIRTIAKILEQEGHKTAKGRDKWNPVSIRAMLNNEKYCGHLLLGKSYTQDYLTHKRVKNRGEKVKYLFKPDDNGEPCVPPIISEEKFKAAQIELERRRKIADPNLENNRSRYSNRHALSGKIKCGKCGATFRRCVWNRGKPYERVAWSCTTYMEKGKSYCDNTSIPQDIIYQAMTLILQNLKQDKDTVLENFMQSAEEAINNTGYETEMLDVQTQINQLNTELKNLRLMRRRNEITEQEFTEDANDIRENLEALNKAYETLESSHALVASKKDKMLLLKETLQKELDTIECTDEIIKGLVKKIVIHSKDNVEIHLSGDIEANMSFGKDISESATQSVLDNTYGNVLSKSTSECTTQSVLLNTFEYDFSCMLPTSKIAKELYNNITFTVYVDI